MRFFTLLFLLTALTCQGCTSRIAQQQDAVAAYQSGDLAYAEEGLTRSIDKSMPNHTFQESKDAVPLLLNRATTRFAEGNAASAIDDYHLAIEAIDFYNQNSAGDAATQLLFQDSNAAYPGDDFEQLLARIYFSLALMHEGDFNNAQALLRQAEEWQQKKTQSYSNSRVTQGVAVPENALAKYLFAVMLEKRGDHSNADILYGQAEVLNADLAPPSISKSEDATVLILCHNGNVPQKYSITSDASVISMFALEVFLGATGIPPAYSSLVGIPVPAYWQNPSAYPLSITTELDGQQQPAKTGYDITAAAEAELHQKMPIIAARAAARLLMRRAAVGCAQKQDPLLGAIIDIGMFVANAATQAETRSWGTLPSRVDLSRFDIPAGEHTFKLHMPGGHAYEARLNLKPGSLCVINVFQIHPGITYVLIPKYSQIKRNPS